MVGRYGRLSVQFGKAMTLADILREVDPKATADDLATMTPPRRRAVITRLAWRVMHEINAVTAVTPGSLVATALLAHDRRGIAQADLFDACDRLARTLRRAGGRWISSRARATSRRTPSAATSSTSSLPRRACRSIWRRTSSCTSSWRARSSRRRSSPPARP
jgi:glycerol-3-phosphate O-acyltransferase